MGSVATITERIDRLDKNKQLSIAIGGSRKSKTWKTINISWSDFLSKISSPQVGIETVEQFKQMPKDERDELKDVGGFVGGALSGTQRINKNIVSRSMITLDADSIAKKDLQPLLDMVASLDVRAAVYSTRNHVDKAPRLRIVIPLDAPCTPDEYEPVARMVASLIWRDLSVFDKTTFDVVRMMYWPSTCSDGKFLLTEYEGSEGDYLKKETMLGMYDNWVDYATWPQVPGAAELRLTSAKRQRNPREATGIIGEFNTVYNVETAIDEFLQDTYTPCGEGRYTYLGATTTGGAVIYEDGDFIYSNHASDPACGRLCNAFDIVRIHLFGHLDTEDKADVAEANKPSVKEMCRFATQIPEVRTLGLRERVAKESDALPVEDIDNDDEMFDWLKKLETDERTGKSLATINNFITILENDRNLNGRVAFNQMSGAIKILDYLIWDVRNMPPCRDWCDADDARLRHYVEHRYKLYSPPKLYDAINTCAHMHGYHPVRDYLKSLKWDGVPRVDELLIKYFKVEDNPYTRQVMRKTLVGAVMRAMKPGCKFDTMLIISGAQGTGKTSFFEILGGEWFSDSLDSFKKGKLSGEQIQGQWIIEVGELATMRGAEREDVKSFMTSRNDKYRSAYAHRVAEHPRECILVGTTNDTRFLRDDTGGRRFWPVDATTTKEDTKKIFDELPGERDQIWAEAYYLYEQGETGHLEDRDVKEMAEEQQEAHAEENPKMGMVKEYLDTKIPIDWYDKSIEVKRNILSGAVVVGGPKMRREYISPSEIFVECFERPLGNLTKRDSIEINSILKSLRDWEPAKNKYYCGKSYGRQRVYVRKGK